MAPFSQGIFGKEEKGKARLLAFQASPRLKGFTAQLMKTVLEGAREIPDVEIEEIFLPNEHFEFCRGCFSCKSVPYHCPLKDPMGQRGEGWLHRKLEEANGFLITLPTYLWSANALAHAFFERCYPFIWSQQLNGIPFAFVTSAYNSGMHREAARWLEKWAFLLSLSLIGGRPIHYVEFKEAKGELKEMGRSLAQAVLKDFQEGRQTTTPEERYTRALKESWDLLGLYLDNITGGTGQKEDLLTTIAFQKEWFTCRESFRLFQEVDDLFRNIIDCIDSGQKEEAARLLSKAHRIWKDGTYMEFISRNR